MLKSAVKYASASQYNNYSIVAKKERRIDSDYNNNGNVDALIAQNAHTSSQGHPMASINFFSFFKFLLVENKAFIANMLIVNNKHTVESLPGSLKQFF